MRDTLIVLFTLIAAVVIGGLLYLFGPSIFQTVPSTTTSLHGGNVTYTVIAAGKNAPGIDTRVNYRITTSDQLVALWDMVYGESGPSVPIIDFDKYEVLAVFDGSHTTSGYDIKVSSVSDSNGMRTVTVTRTMPGPNCSTGGSITSPFVIISAPKTPLQLTHIDEEHVTNC